MRGFFGASTFRGRGPSRLLAVKGLIVRVRFPRIDEARRRHRRRLVAACVVAGFLALSAGSSSFAAVSKPSVGTCNGTSYSSTEALLACLVRLANPREYQPRDMILGAPSDVVMSTVTEAPPKPGSDVSLRNMREVNQWRANPQSWIDAKNRLATGSGLSTSDINSTARWAPRITKALKLGGGALSVLAGDTLVTMVLRDGVVVPVVQSQTGLTADDQQQTREDAYCVRYGNVVTDWLGGWVGADCADWRLDRDYEDKLKRDMKVKGTLCGSGFCFTIEVRGSSEFLDNPTSVNRKTLEMCRITSGSPPHPSRFAIEADVVASTGLLKRSFGSGSGRNFGGLCTAGSVSYINLDSAHDGAVQAQATGVRLLVDGAVVDSLAATTIGGRPSEWVTRVRCLDGSTRFAFSAPFEGVGGATGTPSAVSASGCQPVGVDMGIQRPGSGAGGGWGSVSNPDRTQVGTSEVPQEVQDWMTQFPQCMDGHCQLLLKKRVGTGLVNCFDDPEACLEWNAERVSDPTRYECWYAGVKIALDRCSLYRKTFDTLAVRRGVVWEDPRQTGNPYPGRPTNPGVKPEPKPVPDPESNGNECWPQGWAAFNPLEWVLQPVKCALRWAFVPRAEKVNDVKAALRVSIDDSAIGQVGYAVDAWKARLDGIRPSGCAGPTVTLNLMGIRYSGTPLSACAEPAATLAFWARIFLGAGAVVLAVIGISRHIGRLFNFDGFGRGGGDT